MAKKQFTVCWKEEKDELANWKERLNSINEKRPYKVAFTNVVRRGIELALKELETDA